MPLDELAGKLPRLARVVGIVPAFGGGPRSVVPAIPRLAPGSVVGRVGPNVFPLFVVTPAGGDRRARYRRNRSARGSRRPPSPNPRSRPVRWPRSLRSARSTSARRSGWRSRADRRSRRKNPRRRTRHGFPSPSIRHGTCRRGPGRSHRSGGWNGTRRSRTTRSACLAATRRLRSSPPADPDRDTGRFAPVLLSRNDSPREVIVADARCEPTGPLSVTVCDPIPRPAE